MWARAWWRYLRRDLPELVFPSSMPDPPGSEAFKRDAEWRAMPFSRKVEARWKAVVRVRESLPEAWALYRATWAEDVGTSPRRGSEEGGEPEGRGGEAGFSGRAEEAEGADADGAGGTSGLGPELGAPRSKPRRERPVACGKLGGSSAPAIRPRAPPLIRCSVDGALLFRAAAATIATARRTGQERLKPLLEEAYRSRAAAYRDAIHQFAECVRLSCLLATCAFRLNLLRSCVAVLPCLSPQGLPGWPCGLLARGRS